MAKRIIRLTESDLMRIVKRVIKENNPQPTSIPPHVVAAADKFSNALQKSGNDTEEYAEQAIYTLKNKQELDMFEQLVLKKRGKSAKDIYNEFMSNWDPEYESINAHIYNITSKAGKPIEWAIEGNRSSIGGAAAKFKKSFNVLNATGWK